MMSIYDIKFLIYVFCNWNYVPAGNETSDASSFGSSATRNDECSTLTKRKTPMCSKSSTPHLEIINLISIQPSKCVRQPAHVFQSIPFFPCSFPGTKNSAGEPVNIASVLFL